MNEYSNTTRRGFLGLVSRMVAGVSLLLVAPHTSVRATTPERPDRQPWRYAYLSRFDSFVPSTPVVVKRLATRGDVVEIVYAPSEEMSSFAHQHKGTNLDLGMRHM